MTENEAVYKLRGKRGEGSTQQQMKFYADPDVLPWLRMQQNRNRYINELIRKDFLKKSREKKAD